MISVVVPTISGREESLARTLDAYEETLAGEAKQIIVLKDRHSWPAACNEGYLSTSGEIVHFGADDLVPLPGWWQAAVAHLDERDELPAARVMNYTEDGEMDNAADGPDGAIVHFTRVPILRRDQYERIGPWPDITYMADVWVSEKARTLGIETRILYGYAFVHHWHQHGRVDSPENVARSHQDMERLRRKMRR